MMENSIIKKITNRIRKNQRQVFGERNIMHPEREWFLGILVAVVFLGIGVVWSTETYLQFNNILLEGEAEEENVFYKESLIQTALADFAARRKVYEDLKAEFTTEYVDTEKDEVVEMVIDTASTTDVVEEETPVIGEELLNTTQDIRFE